MEALRVCFQIALVIAPHIGYCAQHAEIHRTQSIEGYSPVVSLILLTSNTLRIYYYIGHHFLLALLLQAILGVAVHGVLLCKVLEVHVQQLLDARVTDIYDEDSAAVIETAAAGTPTVAPSSSAAGSGGAAEKQNQAFGDRDDTAPSPNTAAAPAAEWPASSSAAHNGYEGSGDVPPSLAPSAGIGCVTSKFLQVLFRIEDCIEASLLRNTPPQFVYNYAIAATAALVVALLYYVSIGRVWKNAAEVVGYAALGIEALLVLPQILRNARRRSTEGLTMLLILTWVGGDVIKVIYFIYAKQALPFIVCGCFQVFLDIVVVAQLVYYRLIVKRESEVLIEGDDGAGGQYRDGAVPAVDPLESQNMPSLRVL
ncbi:conserved hypothetical protein [Leishmania infantum JPCM5]|uniref:PQ_loop_repeat_-_putative n=2 Tax=Leishmania infantum TaxID=5671 RepID=A0A6L0XG26_LEIIN|nr:conserved hypothetical protein [Leishmania infantum JPCM5]CAC9497389.1 PQ_loop_repeat_-_putative [Leishmania infantum]CAM68921.1 conserved hypothetical protein [Leishmania infantum JPCM5]SUZ42797.1 PQ_loop_repeat_-_putative [Leishmania infantum]|eukprot:XP_001470543.1 conserved hypothetical protein [Leishmania infantum JPCM5]